MISTYFESFYLMTTTISTVGYGDFKGFVDSEPVWAAEMTYLSVVTLLGLILFSSVINEIFSYRSLLTLKKIVSQKTSEIEAYLWDISLVHKHRALEQNLIEECCGHVKQYYVISTRYYFQRNQFF